MNKTFQIIKDIETPKTSDSLTITERLKEGYAKVTGVFVAPQTTNTDLSGIEVSLKIAQQEILPSGFDLSLLAQTPYISMHDATLDISDENIPARSSELEFTVSRISTSVSRTFSLYVILSKE